MTYECLGIKKKYEKLKINFFIVLIAIATCCHVFLKKKN